MFINADASVVGDVLCGCLQLPHPAKLHSGQILFFLQSLQELPDDRMVATQYAVKPVMPSLCNIGGSRQPYKGCVMLIP